MSSAKLAFITALVIMALIGLWRGAGLGLWSLVFGLALAALLLTLQRMASRGMDGLSTLRRWLVWRREEGHFHAFGGVPMRVHDDGRHVWLGGESLLRALGRQEPDDVLAARMPGQWRRDESGKLLLRADAVVAYLASMPGRDDPRVQKLRRYLERDVLYPAAERRRRGQIPPQQPPPQ